MFRVIETFSGIGSQAKALTRIGKPFEIVNTADWDINAILAYCLIHKGKIDINKYAEISDEDVTNFLKGLSLSSDGKKPMSDEAFRRMPMHLKRRLYAAIKETRNMVSITDVMGSDIPDNIDLFTYSFPCQDLSLCGCWHGNKSGIARDAHNRSGMLWEVERILLEMNEMGKELPRFLLMENVTNILSKPHAADFGDWNCDTTLFLGGKEKTTLKELAEVLGKETIDLYNTSDTRGTSQSYGLNYQKTGKELMSQDEIAVMDGGKCIMQLRGVRPFFSNKFDITKHKQYHLLSDYDEKNAFDIEKYVKNLYHAKIRNNDTVDEVEDVGEIAA